MANNRVMCKYFASGACTRGDSCHFSHSWDAQQDTVCKFYLKGSCAYGSKCRYDHIRPSKGPQAPPPRPTVLPPVELKPSASASSSIERAQASPSTSGHAPASPSASTSTPSSSVWRIPSDPEPSWKIDVTTQPEQDDDDDDDLGPPPPPPDPADLPLCSMVFVGGGCPRGKSCPFLHGELCPGCDKECLHPFNLQARNEHMFDCSARQQNAEALEASRDIECAVCLEVVLAKGRLSERRFGILPECSHAFCLECIRNWREGAGTASQNQAVRACPLCRTVSYYVVPSVTWPRTPEEKEKLLAEYRSRTANIPCRHFAFGDGACPFGSSCFYAHRTRDGREAPPEPPRYVTGGGGDDDQGEGAHALTTHAGALDADGSWTTIGPTTARWLQNGPPHSNIAVQMFVQQQPDGRLAMLLRTTDMVSIGRAQARRRFLVIMGIVLLILTSLMTQRKI